MKPAKTICPHCFSTNVRAEVWMNPNTNEHDFFSDDSFQRGLCFACNQHEELHGFLSLIQVDKNKEDIDRLYKEFISGKKEEPRYFQCLVMYTDDRNYEEHVTIKLSSDIEEKDGDIFYFCDSLDDLKALCDKGNEDFIIRKIYLFDY